MNILEKIEHDSKLRGLFFLRVLYYLSIEMRSLLTTDKVSLDAVKRINEINHRLYPVIVDVVDGSNSFGCNRIEILLGMLEKTGFSDFMEASLVESQKELSESPK